MLLVAVVYVCIRRVCFRRSERTRDKAVFCERSTCSLQAPISDVRRSKCPTMQRDGGLPMLCCRVELFENIGLIGHNTGMRDKSRRFQPAIVERL